VYLHLLHLCYLVLLGTQPPVDSSLVGQWSFLMIYSGYNNIAEIIYPKVNTWKLCLKFNIIV
jgi:hypothetical protein